MASTTPKGVDPMVQAVLESLPKCAMLLRAWADRLQQRHERFAALEVDLGALSAHTEQLSAELENSRPTAPVYKNAGSALKGALARSSKVLKEMHGCLEGARDELEAPTQFSALFETASRAMDECLEYVDAYRESCRNFEAGELPVVKEKKQKKDKERKRSTSPKKKDTRASPLLA
jgi:hypothetical protein